MRLHILPREILLVPNPILRVKGIVEVQLLPFQNLQKRRELLVDALTVRTDSDGDFQHRLVLSHQSQIELPIAELGLNVSNILEVVTVRTLHAEIVSS